MYPHRCHQEPSPSRTNVREKTRECNVDRPYPKLAQDTISCPYLSNIITSPQRGRRDPKSHGTGLDCEASLVIDDHHLETVHSHENYPVLNDSH